MQFPTFSNSQHFRAIRRAITCVFAVVAGVGFTPLASADPPKTVGQKWRNSGTCAWDFPGANTYAGPVAASLDRYKDIAPSVRDKLRGRMEKHAYDDFVVISRDRITGRHAYEPVISDMQFGSRLTCAQVSRANWKPDRIERGLVYCESGVCIMVPTAGQNISRIKRKPAVVAQAPAASEPDQQASAEAQKEPDLLDGLAPPAAGPVAAGGGQGGGSAVPVAPTFTQVAANTFTPVAALTPYSGTAGAAQTSNGGTGGGSTGGGGTSGGSTTPVPEPESFTLLLAGLGLLAFKARRAGALRR